MAVDLSRLIPAPMALLGGAKIFRRQTQPLDIPALVRRGLPYSSYDALAGALGVRGSDLAAIIGVAPRTLARRKLARRLSPVESDRLYRVAHIMALTAETLGSLDKARVWLYQENRALGGNPPFSLLDTEIGARLVEEVLQRINHGIYS
ncbi:MAG: DUF2384 domain-containing protein [Candidatus Hydrogenedentes bacterium]|nr:DUF2384 domain-containing protein [Candidatus Hydrogenedentota bacterium]